MPHTPQSRSKSPAKAAVKAAPKVAAPRAKAPVQAAASPKRQAVARPAEPRVMAAPQAAAPPAAAPVASAPPSAGRVAELRVSAHLMTLERGLFCILAAPGSHTGDRRTGLPGVRITLPPASGLAPDAVRIATFRPDGWLDDTAALVQVGVDVGQVLVSIYQEAGSSPEAAPRLQVLRLTGDPRQPAAPNPAPAAPPAATTAEATTEPTPVAQDPEIVAHIQRSGDVGGLFGKRLGVPGSKMWIEGFGINPGDGIDAADIEYQGVLGRGWLSPWVEGGKFCGSRGMALPLLGLRLRLRGALAETHQCTYEATFIDGTTVGPVPAGESCEAESLAALESLQINLEPIGSASRAPRAKGAARAGRR